MQRPLRSWLLPTTLALIGGALSGCGPEPYEAVDRQRSNACDGIDPPDSRSLIDPDAVITEVVICGQPAERHVAGRGSFPFRTVHRLPDAKVPALMAGLTLPDASGTADVCDASLQAVVDFTVTLVELGGCRRMVSPDGGLIGSVDPATVDAPAALADTPIG